MLTPAYKTFATAKKTTNFVNTVTINGQRFTVVALFIDDKCVFTRSYCSEEPNDQVEDIADKQRLVNSTMRQYSDFLNDYFTTAQIIPEPHI